MYLKLPASIFSFKPVLQESAGDDSLSKGELTKSLAEVGKDIATYSKDLSDFTRTTKAEIAKREGEVRKFMAIYQAIELDITAAFKAGVGVAAQNKLLNRIDNLDELVAGKSENAPPYYRTS